MFKILFKMETGGKRWNRQEKFKLFPGYISISYYISYTIQYVIMYDHSHTFFQKMILKYFNIKHFEVK